MKWFRWSMLAAAFCLLAPVAVSANEPCCCECECDPSFRQSDQRDLKGLEEARAARRAALAKKLSALRRTSSRAKPRPSQSR